MDKLTSKFLEAAFFAYDSAVPKIKKGTKFIFAGLLALIGFSILLITLGISVKRNELVTLGFIMKAFAATTGFAMMLPLMITVESIGKRKFTGRGSVTFLTSFFFCQMLVALFISILALPIEARPFLTLNLAVFTLSLALASESKAAKAVTTAIFVLSVTSLFLPYWRNKAERGIKIFNAPKLLQIVPGAISRGEVRFYVNGEPVVWLRMTRDKKFELYDGPGSSDTSRENLKPINDSIIEKLENNEDLISPRNIIQSKPPPVSDQKPDATSSPPGSLASNATIAQPFDASGNWNFSWELFPTYPGYEREIASQWFPAKIERMDDTAYAVILFPDGRIMATFQGNRTRPNFYSGRWARTDNSGYGSFTFDLGNGLIQGKMTDETVDPRPITMKFQKL